MEFLFKWIMKSMIDSPSDCEPAKYYMPLLLLVYVNIG